jgi:hypothetical protein
MKKRHIFLQAAAVATMAIATLITPPDANAAVAASSGSELGPCIGYCCFCLPQNDSCEGGDNLSALCFLNCGTLGVADCQDGECDDGSSRVTCNL